MNRLARGAGTVRSETEAVAAGSGRRGRAGRLMFPIANGIPLRYPPIATWALIATNAVVFLFEVSLSPSGSTSFCTASPWSRHGTSTPCVRQLVVADRLSALRQQHVFAWWLAAPDRQHVDLVAVRQGSRRPTGLRTLSRVLFRLRGAGVDNLRGTECKLHGTGARRLGSDCRVYSVVTCDFFRFLVSLS